MEQSDFVETVKKCTDAEFKKHFHINRRVAFELIRMYAEYTTKETSNAGRKELGAEMALYITFWYLAKTETYKEIAVRFNVTLSSVFRFVHRVTNWIVTISYLYIKWPTEQQMKVSEAKFAKISKFPRVVGAIDGCHIRISCPKTNREVFYNRKKQFSLLLQGIVDADKKFIDIHCGEPGSMHDSRMYRRSNFYRELNSNPNLLGHRGILLGDTGYPDGDRLVTPFKNFGKISAKKNKFNKLHSAARIIVDNAFARLKKRFKRLRMFKSPNIPFITNCVVSACVLHNMSIKSANIDDETEPDNNQIIQSSGSKLPGKRKKIQKKKENMSTRMEIFNELDINNLLN